MRLSRSTFSAYLLFLLSFTALLDVSASSWPDSFENDTIQLIIPSFLNGSTYNLGADLSSAFTRVFGIELEIIPEPTTSTFNAWGNFLNSKKIEKFSFVLKFFLISLAAPNGSQITLVISDKIFYDGLVSPILYNLNDIIFLSFFVNSPISNFLILKFLQI